MKKQDWVKAVARRAGVDERTAVLVMDAFIDIIFATLVKDGIVRVYRIGKLFRKTRAARVAHNFATGEKMQVPEIHIVGFSPSATISALVKAK